MTRSWEAYFRIQPTPISQIAQYAHADKGRTMFDELDRLREAADLHTLLTHYASLAAPDRQAWQDRRMSLENGERRQLTKLHGELIAYGWIEQNTGVVTAARPGEAPGCYRVTSAGLRALKQSAEG